MAEQFTPQRIARLFGCSASRTAARDCAVVLLAGGLGRYRACPAGWTGDVERGLALEALCREPFPDQAVAKLGRKAAAIVERHWPEISHAASQAAHGFGQHVHLRTLENDTQGYYLPFTG